MISLIEQPLARDGDRSSVRSSPGRAGVWSPLLDEYAPDAASHVDEVFTEQAMTPPAAATLLAEHLPLNRIEMLGLTLGDLGRLESLPWHHRDPFDRVMAAQALERDLAIVSSDGAFDACGVAALVGQVGQEAEFVDGRVSHISCACRACPDCREERWHGRPAGG